MPLVRIDTTRRISAEKRTAIGAIVHEAMVETLKVPPDDRFQIVVGHEDAVLNVTPSYLGIAHGEDVVVVQITLNAGRSVEQKRAFYRRIADDLSRELGLDPQDVVINLVEVAKENWSFGNGEAQYAT